jgi:hypothetical protein
MDQLRRRGFREVELPEPRQRSGDWDRQSVVERQWTETGITEQCTCYEDVATQTKANNRKLRRHLTGQRDNGARQEKTKKSGGTLRTPVQGGVPDSGGCARAEEVAGYQRVRGVAGPRRARGRARWGWRVASGGVTTVPWPSERWWTWETTDSGC